MSPYVLLNIGVLVPENSRDARAATVEPKSRSSKIASISVRKVSFVLVRGRSVLARGPRSRALFWDRLSPGLRLLHSILTNKSSSSGEVAPYLRRLEEAEFSTTVGKLGGFARRCLGCMI